MNIKDALIECGITFPKARLGDRASATVAANSLGNALIELVPTQNQQEFRAKVGLGMGSFADVPWVSLFHSKYDFSASRGFFVVYLFSKDSKVVYLSLGVSAGTANQGKWTAVDKERVRVRAALLRGKCDSLGKQGFTLGDDIDFGSEGWRPKSYATATAAYKKYEIVNLANAEVIEKDFLNAFECFAKLIDEGFDVEWAEEPSADNLLDLVDSFVRLAGQPEVGLHISKPLFLRFAAALGSKRFVILTGLAGSGKTKLAQAFARWLTPEDEEKPAYLVIPVGADWTGSDAILGYPDGLDPKRYVTRPALDLIQRAADVESDGTPHFLILDEMNLSHVERYFADLLSLIESGEFTELYRREEPDEKWDGLRSGVEPKFRLPTNLFIIGTVNVDETTYMFSPKVLDRANVIEFRVERKDLVKFLASPRGVDLDAFNAAGFKQGLGQSFTVEAEKKLTAPEGFGKRFEEEMLLLFDLLEAHNGEFGFRVANEAARFLHFHHLLAGEDAKSDTWFDTAMDAVIVQKLLPKLHGSRTKLEGLLWALAFACGADRAGLEPEAFLKLCKEAGKAENEKTYSPEALFDALKLKNSDKPLDAARYKLSFDKILRMYRKLIRDQFVTFSEA